jgi:hypothetical protein
MTIHSLDRKLESPRLDTPCCLTLRLALADPTWISLLDAEGVAWTDGANRSLAEDGPAVVIIPQNTPETKTRELRALVARGAAAICEPGVWPDQRLDQVQTSRMPYDNESFCGLESKEDSRAVEVEQGSLGRGMVFRLPFRLRDLWASRRRARRFIALGNGNCIYEDMAAVVKKNVHRVIVEILKQAFFGQELPYVRKWFYPKEYRSVLCFRGDADGGPTDNLKTWLNAVHPFANAVSLFFCTSRYVHKQDLIAAAADTGIEVGSHNHWHIVFPDRVTNAISLTRAEKVLTAACYRPHGFVAPAYFWHPSLYRLLEERKYQYSSCFGISHDCLPYQPVVDGRIGQVVELPFHCLGDRFPRFDLPLDSPVTRQFFTRLIEKKYAAGEPLFLYGHPDVDGRMGTTPDLVRFILETALSHSDVLACQLANFTRWWRKRTQLRITTWYERASAKFTCDMVSAQNRDVQDVRLYVEFPDGGTHLIDPKSCSVESQPVSADSRITPLKLPETQDVGEVVDRGPEPHRRMIDRRTVRRFLRAYREVYLRRGN